MYKLTVRSLATLATVGSLTLCVAGGSVIGLAVINGTARVDNSDVRGNASIMEGSVVETGKGSSQLSLQSGARVEFGAASRGTVYRDRVVLEKGMGQLHASSSYPVLANSLRVVPSGSDSTVRVAVKDGKSILVSAVAGESQVLNSNGLLLARVNPGSTYEFDQDAGAAAQARITGCVERRGGRYYLRDSTTNVVSELTGPDLGQYVRKNVTVTGSIDTSAAPGSGATQVVRVSTGGVTVNNGAGCGTGGGGAAAAGGGGMAGLSTGATAAIVAGVAVAGIVGGLAAAGTFSSSSSH